MNKKEKVLIIAAHPDDEVLGCGGAIARHVEKNDDVNILILSEGIRSRSNIVKAEESVKILHEHSMRAAELLGCKKVFFANYPDNRMDSLDLLDVVKYIENIMEFLHPTIVYTHHWGDLNIDHVITHKAVVTACRPVSSCSVKRLLFFEVLSSTEWQIGSLNKGFYPNYFINIEAVLKKKIEALKIYDSEMRKYPHSRSIKGIEILARYRGMMIGCNLAEAFLVGKEVLM